MTSPRQVTVSTGARLHFGLLTHRPKTGREFGGLGVMIDATGWTVSVSISDTASDTATALDQIVTADSVVAVCPEAEHRVASVIEQCRQRWESSVPAVTVKVTQAIPSHRGLGSGTQLALATARAISVCLGRDHGSAGELAELTGRGLRSAVGTWGFESGGLIVDGGKLQSSSVGSLAARLEFPSDWRFLLVYPQKIAGLSGDEEIAAFNDLPGMPQETTDALCRLALMELLPAVQEHDFQRVSQTLSEYGRRVGNYFAPAQGGVFVDPRMHDFSSLLSANGVTGFAQSSWGPACAALCSSDDMAEQAAALIQSQSDADGYECVVARPLNHGATVEIDEIAAS